MNKKPKAIFFDLDGTLLDTAADIGTALNRVLQKRGIAPLSLEILRSRVYGGSRVLLKQILNMDENHPEFETLKKEFHQDYRDHLVSQTTFFPGMDDVLHYLEKEKIQWGVITNKPAWLAEPLLKHFKLTQRSACIIGGDTLPFCKPHPAPLLHACQLANTTSDQVCYVGDSEVDITAAKNAGMFSLLAAYGYIPHDVDPNSWGADYYLHQPRDIIEWLKNLP